MTVLTEAKNLDECSFSGGSLADYPCTTTTDWTDSDTGVGVSLCDGQFFDGKSVFKFDVVTAGAGNVASRVRDVGAFATPTWASIRTYFDTLGTNANADYFLARFDDSAYRLSIRFASDGLFIYDGAAWNEVGANVVLQDTWQEWTFGWTVAAAGVVDVYLNDVLIGSAVDCSDSTGGTDGTVTFSQYGTTVQGVSYLDWIKIGVAKRFVAETWEMREGGALTVRSDTRWHANAPASMTGTFSTITVTEGKLVFDGRSVRWLAYDGGGATNVPAIGTSITKGAVTGILLGVYDSITSAPTAVGVAVPADGFIKFLSVSGGAFSAGRILGMALP